MTHSSGEHTDGSHGHPKPKLRKQRWPYWFIWLIPISAAIIATAYYVDARKEHGEEITIAFNDVSGLQPDNTSVSHMGVNIGKVIGIALSDDQRRANVHVRLRRSADAFARKGALFWVVRPEISTENIAGLSTITSGLYIEAMPGAGELASDFNGLQDPPIDVGEGLRIVLHAPRLEHAQSGSAVYFRGIQVGIISSVQLSSDSNGIDVHVFIWHRFMRLVQYNSRFWITPVADVKGGLLSGVQFKLGSLRAIISGGVTFATPDSPPGDNAGQPATDGSQFPLYDEVRKEWLDWSPRIPLPPPDSDDNAQRIGLPEAQQSVQSSVKSNKQ